MTNTKNSMSKIIVCVIVVLLLIGILISAFSKPKLDNGYVDLAKHDSVEFNLNADGLSYTIERKYGFPFSTKPPDELLIPETYNGLPVTILKGKFDNNNIVRLIGSKNLIEISRHCFAEQSDTSHRNLKEVIFPQDGELREIGFWAFFNCAKLEKVVLPQSMESFSIGVFYRCVNLSTLIIYNKIPPQGATGLFQDGYNDNFEFRPSDFTVYVPDNAVEVYRQSDWNRYTIRPISDNI